MFVTDIPKQIQSVLCPAGHGIFSDRPFRSGKTKKTFALFAPSLAPFNSRSEECNAFNWGGSTVLILLLIKKNKMELVKVTVF
jgi:hypothetical protein